jgi:Zn finger protein HypA/HybF involved in hydrogenase expression
MTSCRHATLELLVERKATMRCRRCHLTLAAEELGDGYCPECFDSSGTKHRDFEELSHAGSKAVRYRCEECGIVITSS